MSDLPTFNMPNVFKLRDKLFDRLNYIYTHTTPEGDSLTTFADDVRKLLPGSPPLNTVRDSVSYLAGKELLPDDLMDVSWRLAGNVKLLGEGQAVLPWTRQPEDEWMPMQILRVQPAWNARDKVQQVTLRVLAGRACPMVVGAMWSFKRIRYIARHAGFTRVSDHSLMPYQHPKQCVKLFLLGHVEAARSQRSPQFHQVGVPLWAIAANKELLKMRCRIGWKCPEGYTWPCHNCSVGFETCPAGTHKETYMSRLCTKCGQDGYFDPESHTGHCIACNEHRP